jgi:hypothetical protein
LKHHPDLTIMKGMETGEYSAGIYSRLKPRFREKVY